MEPFRLVVRAVEPVADGIRGFRLGLAEGGEER